MRIAIVGAGFSGTLLYNLLSKANHEVYIFEKSRGVGGRLSTKYFGTNKIDFGTTAFVPKTRALKRYADANLHLLRNEDGVYSAKEGMNRLCMVDGNIKFHTKIKALHKEGALFTLLDEENNHYIGFERVIFTLPAPQLKPFGFELNVEYNAVSTLIAYAKLPVDINDVKGKVVYQNYKNFYNYLFLFDGYTTSDKELLKRELEQKLAFDVNLEEFEESVAHVWRYATPKSTLSEEYIYADGVGLCGDYFGFGNLDGAYQSALKLYERITT